MRKAMKIWFIVAASLVLAGLLTFVGVMTMLNWDFTKLSTTKYETNTHEINESYEHIRIVTDTADIALVPSDSEKTTVVCHEQKNIAHTVEVKDGVLSVTRTDTRKWYEYIGINFGSTKITVSIPRADYGALSIECNTGKVEIPNDFEFSSIHISGSTGAVKCSARTAGETKIKISTGDIFVERTVVGALDLSTSTGKITASSVNSKTTVAIGVSTGKAVLDDVRCNTLTSSGDTGDITLKNVIATEKMSIERSTGDVKLDGCDAAEIVVKTDTGDVTGTLLSEKVFIPRTDTGKIQVPSSVTGGKCEITSDTGDIKISIS